MKFMILLSGLLSLQVHAEVLSLDTLNQHLRETGAQWQAKDNWLNHLSTEELKNMMGARGVEPRGLEFSTQNYTPANPEVFDWRNVNGQNYVSPVLNQGNCGSCVAFATVGTLETQMNVATNNPLFNPKFSAEALFACGGGSCHGGWWPVAASRFLKTTGVPDEACAPYSMGATGKDASCSSICKDSEKRVQKVADFSSPFGIEAVKQALKKGPMVTTLFVYADFITYSGGVYKHTVGEPLGGHAISLIGFDDEKQAWIIRNSWGPDWGMGGFGYVAYDDTSGVGERNQQFVVDAVPGYLWTDLVDRSFLSGKTEFSVRGNASANEPATVNITGPEGSILSESSCMEATCPVRLDSQSMVDGRYEMTARQGNQELHRYFYIANTPAPYALKMSAKEFDPTKPVKGRIEFGISINTSSVVPLERLALAYQNEAGEIKERWTTNIASDMTLGWRTPMAPNGTYKVWIKGENHAGGLVQRYESKKVTLELAN